MNIVVRRPDPSRVFVQVGLGFFLELTHEETLWFVTRREGLLEDELQRLSKESASIKAHIQMVVQVTGLNSHVLLVSNLQNIWKQHLHVISC